MALALRWACLLALAGAASAEFLVLEGFAGLAIPSPAFQVSAPTFDVTAQLVASNESEWSYAPCPPRHLGRQSLEGKLMLFSSLQLSCSRKELGQVLLEHRAAGLLVLGPESGLVDTVPGRWFYSHGIGEDRSPLALPMVHVLGAFPHAVYSAVRDGAVVRARLTPSPNRWLVDWRSWWWLTWQVALTLQSVVVLELAALRLYAHVRESGGPELSIAQALLLIEIIAHAQRALFFAVDPYWSRGVYSEAVAVWIASNHLVFHSLGRALFLVFYTQAADLAGIATFRIAQPFWARSLIGTMAAILVLDTVTCVFTLQSGLLVILRGEQQRRRRLARAAARELTLSARAPPPQLLSALRPAPRLTLPARAPPSPPPPALRSDDDGRAGAASRAAALPARLPARGAQAQVLARAAAQQGEDGDGPFLPTLAARVGLWHHTVRGGRQPAHAGVHALWLPLRPQRRLLRAGKAPPRPPPRARPACRSHQRLRPAAPGALSSAQVLVFRPFIVPVPVGPLGYVGGLIAALVARCRARARRAARAGSAKPATDVLAAHKPAQRARVAPLENPSLSAMAAPAEPMLWLQLGISLRFARECQWALDLDVSRSAAHARGRMLGSAGAAGARLRSVVERYEMARTLDGEPAVGRATVLVVHSAEMPFGQLTEALAAYEGQHRAEGRPQFFWLADFSRRKVLLRQRELLETIELIRATRRVAIALERWDSPMPMELLAQAAAQDALQDVDVSIILPDAERARFVRALAEAPEATREAMLAATSACLAAMPPAADETPFAHSAPKLGAHTLGLRASETEPTIHV